MGILGTELCVAIMHPSVTHYYSRTKGGTYYECVYQYLTDILYCYGRIEFSKGISKYVQYPIGTTGH